MSSVQCVKNILWPDLQTFLVETIQYYVFDLEEKVGKYPILNFMIRMIRNSYPQFYNKFLDNYFFNLQKRL